MLRLRCSILPAETRLRLSHPTQLAAAKATSEAREAMIAEWAEWLAGRAGSASNIPRPLIHRQCRLVVDTLVEMLGPLKREARIVWQHALEHYGRNAAARGLAAGEVVEDLQQLRVLLIKYIGASVAAMRPRRAVAIFLRLNAIIDRGIAAAVVGYTDALVGSLLVTESEPRLLIDATEDALIDQLDALELELKPLTRRR